MSGPPWINMPDGGKLRHCPKDNVPTLTVVILNNKHLAESDDPQHHNRKMQTT